MAFDQVIEHCLSEGAERVVNLAAGLDTRRYRMALPSKLSWIEVDLSDLLDYKESILADETPRCQLERVRLDLSDLVARRQFFARLSAEPRPTLAVRLKRLGWLDRLLAKLPDRFSPRAPWGGVCLLEVAPPRIG